MELWGIGVPGFVLIAVWALLQGWRTQGRERWLPVAGALAWFGYWYWEAQVVQDGDNIRVDLVLFFPILLGLTIASTKSLWRMYKRRQIPPPPPPGTP